MRKRLSKRAVYNASRPSPMKRLILIYGACGGLLIIILQLVEYRFLVLEYSREIYGSLVAAILQPWVSG